MYKPFNLQAALNGAPVITRDGRPVSQLHLFECVDQQKLHGVLGGYVQSWSVDGKYSFSRKEVEADLFMAPTTRKEWVVIYGLPNDRRCTAGPFQTDNGPNVFIQTLSSEYKATIHEITITE